MYSLMFQLYLTVRPKSVVSTAYCPRCFTETRPPDKLTGRLTSSPFTWRLNKTNRNRMSLIVRPARLLIWVICHLRVEVHHLCYSVKLNSFFFLQWPQFKLRHGILLSVTHDWPVTLCSQHQSHSHA